MCHGSEWVTPRNHLVATSPARVRRDRWKAAKEGADRTQNDILAVRNYPKLVYNIYIYIYIFHLYICMHIHIIIYDIHLDVLAISWNFLDALLLLLMFSNAEYG